MPTKGENIYRITKDSYDKFWEADTFLDKKINEATIFTTSIFGVLAIIFTYSPLINIILSLEGFIFLFIIIIFTLSFFFLGKTLYECSKLYLIGAQIYLPLIKEERIDSVRNINKTLIKISKKYAKYAEYLLELNHRKEKDLANIFRMLNNGIILLALNFFILASIIIIPKIINMVC